MITSSKSSNSERLSYSSNYEYSHYSHDVIDVKQSETAATPNMSIILKNNESTLFSNEPIYPTNNLVPVAMPSTVVYKPMPSVIQSTNSNGRCPASQCDRTLNLNVQSLAHPNQYFVLRPTAETTSVNNPPPVYRERSIEETEAAHDLLSLSQSLPPLPAPCVVTILHPVSNYNGNSPDVQEITPNQSNEYITYTCSEAIQCQADNTEVYGPNKRNVSTQFDADMLPDDSSSFGKFVTSPNVILYSF